MIKMKTVDKMMMIVFGLACVTAVFVAAIQFLK